VLTLDSVFAGVVARSISPRPRRRPQSSLVFGCRRGATSFAAGRRRRVWAATTALAASASWAALGTAAIAFAVLGAVWLISPSRA
jgi:putative exporter of polyketide antibiotics